ncbi:DUF2934 domain-containing protein [Paraburkholderia tropica]|uniref:DUF2934 domain-containing protein n=1 Tax=Paraburkholderia tropica TaxID=92647 RepID=A0A1A5X271_9BURK|nr:DUF2934 domain-containing protein [Paraburkholderia tropica]MBB2981647.1 hypothetical protein [Paraburkholderia tropica]MBB3005161.1 hypothetical protein [Paraburkholderia tropica]MBB6320693.1 hypothetical protein [Paraburkholderia tropica]MDE1138463.1 DUF2934 domain-containing protein [Paraburkholderia tropica]OBR47547.1 hypothetical protein A6456_32125 [Paraburkholderia tropica]
MNDEREERIRRRAYQLWEDDGSPEGKADEYWGRAEKQVAAEYDAEGEVSDVATDQASKRRHAGAPLQEADVMPPAELARDKRRG